MRPPLTYKAARIQHTSSLCSETRESRRGAVDTVPAGAALIAPLQLKHSNYENLAIKLFIQAAQKYIEKSL